MGARNDKGSDVALAGSNAEPKKDARREGSKREQLGNGSESCDRLPIATEEDDVETALRRLPLAWLCALALLALTLVPGSAKATAFSRIAAATQLAPTRSARLTSPTRAQGAWLGTRPRTSLGEVDHPQARRAEDGRVGATQNEHEYPVAQ